MIWLPEGVARVHLVEMDSKEQLSITNFIDKLEHDGDC